MSATRSPGTALLIAVLRGYQRWISPFLTPRCRFYPSCSSYAVQALSSHGLRTGGWLAVRRLLRCQPFADGGVDQVPDAALSRRPPEPAAPSAVTGVSS